MATQKERTDAATSKILSTALRLISKQGNWDGISVSDLEKESGLTRGALFHHYKDKADLFSAVVERYYFNRATAENVPDSYRFTLRDFYMYYCSLLSDEITRFKIDGIEDIQSAWLHIELSASDIMSDFEERCAQKLLDEKGVWNLVICNAIQSGEIMPTNPLILTNMFFNLCVGATRGDALINCQTEIEPLKRQLENLYSLVRSNPNNENSSETTNINVK